MLIGIIGENCSGKSTLAARLQDGIGARVVSGKDYLRLAKSESEATARFRGQLQDAVSAAVGGEHLIYVISEPEQLRLLPEGAVRILVTAELDEIKARFRARLRGNLPPPVEKMLEKKHGMFDAGVYDYRYDGVHGDADALCEELKRRIEGG